MNSEKIIILLLMVMLSHSGFVSGELKIPVVARFGRSLDDFDWTYGDSAEKTYLFTNAHWWESIDHQLTTIITLLTLAQNTSSIAVIPPIATLTGSGQANISLLGQYYDIDKISEVQPVMTMDAFMHSKDYETLSSIEAGSIALPKESLEEYEQRLKIFGKLYRTAIHLNMPAVDPENTNQPCHRFSGTMQLSPDRKRRYIFLDRIHFLHFCTEIFMPWWYDVRFHIQPRRAYMEVGKKFMYKIRRPLTVIHINDVMGTQKVREADEIETYAGQIVDGLRRFESVDRGSVYVIYNKHGRNVFQVVSLLQREFQTVYDCSNMFKCLDEVTPDMITSEKLSHSKFKTLFRSKQNDIPISMAEWALASQADLFIGNVHSPFSRNICLHRKMQGKPYSIVRGFAELRKVWKWNL